MKQNKGSSDHLENNELRVPIVEEHISVNKRIKQGRTVTVKTSVVEDHQSVEETIANERINVKRVPREEVITVQPSIQKINNTTIIPVVEERLVIKKELVLVEEIHLEKQVCEEVVLKKVPVRRTHVTVDDPDTP